MSQNQIYPKKPNNLPNLKKWWLIMSTPTHWPQLKSLQNALSTAAAGTSDTQNQNYYRPLFIFREDKKIIPLNFVNKALKAWIHFNDIKDNSITRVGQGFSLRCLYPSALPLPDYFELETIRYGCKRPSCPENFLGEAVVYLSDSDDYELLNLSDAELQELIEIPGSQGTQNAIRSVKQSFPKRGSQAYSNNNQYKMLKLSIAFTTVIPEIIAFQNLISRVSKSTPPPIRCYRCQRYGHGSMTCR